MQVLSISDAIAMLFSELEAMKKELAQSSAAPSILSAKKLRISRLHNSINVLRQFQSPDLWLQIEAIFKEMKKEDSKMNGVNIMLKAKGGEEKFGFIQMDLS